MSVFINMVTRNRPEVMLKTVETTLANIQHPKTELLVSLDKDDEATLRAVEEYGTRPQLSWSNRAREDSIGEKWNRSLNLPGWTVALPMCDDCAHITPGFDVKILEASELFPDKIGYIYNHLFCASFPSVIGFTRRLVEIVGYVYPPHFPYWFVDHWADDMAKMLGRISFADIETDQTLSPKLGTMERREPAFWATFFDATFHLRKSDVAKIVNSPDFQEPEWRKKMLLGRAPLTEYYSKWVNDTVRNMAHLMPIEPGDGGERYARLKAKAVAMLREAVTVMERAA